MQTPSRGRPEEPERLRLLLEASFGEGLSRRAARDRLERLPGGAEERRELERDLAEARGELLDLPGFGARREGALVERVLARTTRAEPARGAPRRWGFVAAAALVASAGAWLVARGTGDGAPGPLDGARGDVRVADLRPDGGLEDVLALARAQLGQTASAARAAAPARAASPSDPPLELRLLEARERGLRERRWEPWLEELSLPDLGTLALALWCEVQLDRFALSGERPPAWRKAVHILEADLERSVPPRESSKLLARALERAREYGWTEDGPALARGESLWSREWFRDLESAGREAGLADTSAWRAWLDWRGG